MAKRELKVYMAGPLFTSAELTFNNKLAFELERRGFETLMPQYFCDEMSDPTKIAELCLSMVVVSDVIIVNCDGADVESGTAFEAGYARGLGKPIIAYRTDSRSAGDHSLWPVNLMIGGQAKKFILESSFTEVLEKLTTVLAREELARAGERAESIIASWPEWKRRIIQ